MNYLPGINGTFSDEEGEQAREIDYRGRRLVDYSDSSDSVGDDDTDDETFAYLDNSDDVVINDSASLDDIDFFNISPETITLNE